MISKNDMNSRMAALRPKLLRYCYSLTRNGAEAEDLAQEALLKVTKRLRVRSDLPISNAYVLRVARIAWIDLYRRRRRNQTHSIDDLPVEPAASPVADALVTRAELEMLLHRLPAKPFVILLLCDVFGLTAREAGLRIRMAEGSVQVALSRARSRLRRLAQNTRGERSRPAPVHRRFDLLVDATMDAFRRRDPDHIYRAYLRLFEAGSSLVGIRRAQDRLSFTLSDPDGNLITIAGQFSAEP